MNKKVLLSAVLLVGALSATAQDQSSSACGDNLPEKGNWTVAATIGYNSYASVKAQPGNLYEYSTEAPVINWNDKNISLGVEGGYFFNEKWKLGFGAGLHFSKTPGYTGVPGTIGSGTIEDIEQFPLYDTEDNMGNIPTYLAVTDGYNFSYNVFADINRYWRLKKVPNMALYCGLRVGYSYAVNEQKADEYDWMGKSSAETWNLRGAFVFGADYYFLPAMWVGISFEPVNYAYSVVTYKPQEGLRTLSADAHNVGFIANPTLKIGFKF